MKPSTRVSRRRILKAAGLAIAAPYLVPAAARGQDAPSHCVTLGMIGLGSMGLRHVKGFLEEDTCRILAVCDVDAARRQEAVREVNTFYGDNGCTQYNDYRELLARDDVDALCIAVPDHWHSIVAIDSIRAGKDIYGEKPLAFTIGEGRDIVREVRRTSCVWETGSWQRSTAHFRFACELVRNGRIGKLERVEVGIGTGTQIEPQPPMPVPPGFDYERWLGPAPWAPYTEKRCHWNFRWILDYSGGQVTDWGAHHLDIAQWGMGTDDTGPVEVMGVGEFPRVGLWDAAVDYRVEATYANGVRLLAGSTNHHAQGVKFIGDAGWVHVTRNGLKTEPENLVRESFGPDEIHLPRPTGNERQGHRADFLNCVKTRQEPIASVEIGHRSITIAHLWNISMILGRKVRWDPAREVIIGDDTANRMQRRAMRAPWHH
ncbi:MAG TPA: Gfo/Idh/MocA family oxidoreductase [Candidatus Hydrogenedentes bacterium]|nr:Gfo/Idh/MocA family oxidoreductase [Candidatus Hydrogenedentota bacterium]HPG69636.1 Gfo/Idh/MocA family oxidoreductase [Candidatus Hydrogenedentota bacterium]